MEIRPVFEQPPVRLDLDGDLSGQSVEDLAVRLSILAATARPRVRLDLTRVPHMSVRAQVLLLAIARAMRIRGGELVLYGPRPSLRAEGSRVDLFNRIRTVDAPVADDGRSDDPGPLLKRQ